MKVNRTLDGILGLCPNCEYFTIDIDGVPFCKLHNYSKHDLIDDWCVNKPFLGCCQDRVDRLFKRA